MPVPWTPSRGDDRWKHATPHTTSTRHPTAELTWAKWNAPDHNLLGWRATQGALPTDDVLQRRGTSLASRCPTSKTDTENLAHLLGSCRYLLPLWRPIAATINVRLDGRSSLAQIAAEINRTTPSKPLGRLKTSLVLAALEVAWHTRNHARHTGTVIAPAQLLCRLGQSLAKLLTHRRINHSLWRRLRTVPLIPIAAPYLLARRARSLESLSWVLAADAFIFTTPPFAQHGHQWIAGHLILRRSNRPIASMQWRVPSRVRYSQFVRG